MLTLMLGVNSALEINVFLSSVNTEDGCEHSLRVVHTELLRLRKRTTNFNILMAGYSFLLRRYGFHLYSRSLSLRVNEPLLY